MSNKATSSSSNVKPREYFFVELLKTMLEKAMRKSSTKAMFELIGSMY